MRCFVFALLSVATAETGRYTSCTDYKSASGCKKSALKCEWDSSASSCSSAGDSPTSAPTSARRRGSPSPPAPAPAPGPGPKPGPKPSGNSPTCVNDDGDAVDFFYAFKSPKDYAYAYMDSKTTMAKSSKQLNSVDSAVSKSLAPAYGSSNSGVGHVFWNDEHPGGNTVGAPWAHMKGALVFNSDGGIWLTQSLPKFPAAASDGADHMWDQASQATYGQSYLCITMGADAIKKLGPAMQVMKPSVYDADVAGALATAFPEVVAWAVDGTWTTDSVSTTVAFSSAGGQAFTMYGTGPDFGDDLYAQLLVPAIGDVVAETWQHGEGDIGATCTSGHKVLDATSVTIAGEEWSTESDHSKWALSKDSFCVGDKNRQTGQFKRGGGIICIQDANVVSQMQKVVTTTDSCGGTLVV